MPAFAQRLPPASGIRAVFDRAAELERDGREVLHLEIGRPDWRLAPGAADAAKAALDAGDVHYIANRGLLELRAAYAQDIADSSGRSFDPVTELIITAGGASEALAACALALLDAGDEAIVPEPAWNHYAAAIELAGATAVRLSLRPEAGYALDPDELAAAITPATRLLVLNSPSNPTGAVQSPDVLKAVAELALDHDLYVFADEVYRHFVYDGEHVSIARYMGDSDRLLYVNSVSKSLGMTGWRVGVLGAAAPICDAVNRVHQYLTVCGSPFVQRGVLATLTDARLGAYLADLQTEFARRRNAWREALDGVPGFEVDWPGGAFYLFPRIAYRDLEGEALASALLEEHGLATVPGDVFGHGFGRHVRISYGGVLDVQQRAAARLAEVLRGG